MPVYDFKCWNKECEDFNIEKAYDMTVKEYKEMLYIACECCGEPLHRSYSSMPAVHYKGLGFYTTDKEYEEQIKLAEAIADKMYEKRAKKSVEEDSISKDDAFWEELASQDFAKEVKRRDYFVPRKPTTVIKKFEEKASTNIVK